MKYEELFDKAKSNLIESLGDYYTDFLTDWICYMIEDWPEYKQRKVLDNFECIREKIDDLIMEIVSKGSIDIPNFIEKMIDKKDK